MAYKRNSASPAAIKAKVVKASDGSAITSGVAAYHIQGTTRGAGAGTLSAHIANGLWSYTPTQGETDYAEFAIEFYHVDAVAGGPVVQVITDAKLTSELNDAAAAPSAADIWSHGTRTLTSFGSLVSDMASAVWGAVTRTLTAGTNIVLAKGTGITGFNDVSAADVNAQCDQALADYDGPTKAELDAAVAPLATAADLATTAGYIDTEVATIIGVTDKLDTALELDGLVYRFTTNALEQAPAGEGGGGPTAGQIADAVWDEARSGHTTPGTFGLYLDAQVSSISGPGGSGAISKTISAVNASDAPVADALVWVTTTTTNANPVASGRTDNFGNVTFQLDAGTYYWWAKKSGQNFANPTQFTVSA